MKSLWLLGSILLLCYNVHAVANDNFIPYLTVPELGNYFNKNDATYTVDTLYKNPNSILQRLANDFPDLKPNIREYKIMFSPALWLPEIDSYLVVSRLFRWHHNSFLYATLFDEGWNEITEPTRFMSLTVPCFLPIIDPKPNTVYSGPEDPRIFFHGKDILCSFNMKDADSKRKMWFYNFTDSQTTPLSLQDYTVSSVTKIPNAEKNWSALSVKDDHLYMVYNYHNFQVIDCNDYKAKTPCPMVRGKFDDIITELKGGSPYVRFKNSDYYFSIAYTNIRNPRYNSGSRIYRPAVAVIHVPNGGDPDSIKLIYTGGVLDFADSCVSLAKRTKSPVGVADVLTVPSIARCNYDDDKVIVTANVDDVFNVVVTINGMIRFLDNIIGLYEKNLLGASECDAVNFAKAHANKNVRVK